MKQEIVLTTEQKQQLVDFWNSRKENPPSLAEMTEQLYPGQQKDGRSFEGRAIKQALSSMKIKASTTTNYVKKSDGVDISDAQKEFIRNHANMNYWEIARELFGKPGLTNLDIESRAVRQYMKEEGLIEEDKKEVLEDYKPPRKFEETLARINCYIPHKLDRNKLTPGQKKDIETTQAYLHDPRFLYLINASIQQRTRDLFEGSFIKYIYNKSDISLEELEQFINLASAVVSEVDSTAELSRLKVAQMELLDHSGIVSKAMADRITGLEKSIQETKNYQDKLIKTLQGERNKRIEQRMSKDSSISALIEAFKSEDHRRKMATFTESMDEKVRDALKEMQSMDGLIGEIWGIAPEEIVSNPKE